MVFTLLLIDTLYLEGNGYYSLHTLNHYGDNILFYHPNLLGFPAWRNTWQLYSKRI